MKNNENISLSDKIAILDIYMNEWIQRDRGLFGEMKKTGFIALIIMVLPYIKLYFGIKGDLPFDDWIFPLAGIIVLIVFMPLHIGNLERQKKSSETVIKIINLLPEELKRESIEEKRISKKRIAYYQTLIYQGLEILLGVVLLIILV